MAAPEDYPRDPDNTITSRTWAEGGVVSVPSSARQNTGWLNGDTVTQGEVNYLGREPARWNRASQAQHLRSSGALNGSWIYTGKTFPAAEGFGTWSETGVINPLEVFLSDVTGIPSRAVDVWIDALGNGAVGLQVKVALASPLLLTANSDNYIFIDDTEAVAGLGGGMTVLAVPNGNPAPATPAGSVLVWMLETDASNLTGQTIILPTIPVYKAIGVESIGVGGNVTISGDLDVDGQFEAKGPMLLGDSILDILTCEADSTFRKVTIAGMALGTTGLTITGPGDIVASTVDGAASGAMQLTNASVSSTLVVAQTGTGRAGLMSNDDGASCTLKLEQLGAGCALEAQSTGAGSTVASTNTGSGAAVSGVNTGTGSGGSFANNDATAPALTCANAGAGPSLNLTSGNLTLDAGVGIVGTATSPITGGQITSLTLMESANGYQGIAGAVPALPQGATVPTTKSIALVGTASVTGPSTASLTAGTVDTIDADGVVNVGELAFYSDANTSPTSGVLQWDGRSLTIGDGSLASGRRLPAPVDAFVAGDITTINANTSTGLTASLTLAANESIMIQFFGEMTNSDAVPVILFNIEVNAVVVGGTGNREAPASGRFMDVSRRYKYTAGGAPEVASIEVFYGASNGTTTARNLLLTVRRVN